MSCGDERHARPETGAENSHSLVALLDKPVDTGAGIDNGLPGSVECTTDIARDMIVGALELRRHALGMVSHRHTQGADAEPVQQAGEAYMSIRARVPLR